MSVNWQSRPRALEECDRLSAYAEYMRDFADQCLADRQRATWRDRIFALSVLGIAVGLCLFLRWFQ